MSYVSEWSLLHHSGTFLGAVSLVLVGWFKFPLKYQGSNFFSGFVRFCAGVITSILSRFTETSISWMTERQEMKISRGCFLRIFRLKIKAKWLRGNRIGDSCLESVNDTSKQKKKKLGPRWLRFWRPEINLRLYSFVFFFVILPTKETLESNLIMFCVPGTFDRFSIANSSLYTNLCISV